MARGFPTALRTTYSRAAPEGVQPSTALLINTAIRQYTMGIAVKVIALLAAPWTDCDSGAPMWAYGLAALFLMQCAWSSYSLTTYMRKNRFFEKRYKELGASWNPFSNYFLLIFLWGPIDQADRFTDAVTVLQQKRCDERIRDRWLASWAQSNYFSSLEHVMGIVQLAGLQLAGLIFCEMVQGYIVYFAGTHITEVRVRMSRCVDQIAFIYSDILPKASTGTVETGSREHRFRLLDGEYLVEIRGWRNGPGGSLVTVELVTNSGRVSKRIGDWDDARTPYSFQAPDGHEITGIRGPERLTPDCPIIEDIITRPRDGIPATAGTSEAAALDLASMPGPAELLATDEFQRWGRAFQVSLARVLLEAALQTWLGCVAFQLSFDYMGPWARRKAIVSIFLSIGAALPWAQELVLLAPTFYSAGALLCIMTGAFAFAALKVVMAYECPDHIWGISGCVDLSKPP